MLTFRSSSFGLVQTLVISVDPGGEGGNTDHSLAAKLGSTDTSVDREDARPSRRAVNAVTQEQLEHHPIFQQFDDHWAWPLASHLIDMTGTHTSVVYDCVCDILGYCSVPNRKALCKFAEQWGQAVPQAPVLAPLPLIDEEYFQWIAVLQAVERANTAFVMLELGARYATWLVRGAQAHRRRNGPRGSAVLIATEASPHWVRLTNEHCTTNEINCTVHNGWHGPPDLQIQGGQDWHTSHIPRITLHELLEPLSHVDHIDMDIEGFEVELMRENGIVQLLTERVSSIFIQTHDIHGEEFILDLLLKAGWELVHGLPVAGYCGTWYGCSTILSYGNTMPGPERKTVASNVHECPRALYNDQGTGANMSHPKKTRQTKPKSCLYETAYGPIAHAEPCSFGTSIPQHINFVAYGISCRGTDCLVENHVHGSIHYCRGPTSISPHSGDHQTSI